MARSRSSPRSSPPSCAASGRWPTPWIATCEALRLAIIDARMGLFEFLRQWQGSRLAGGIALSVLLHLMVVAAILWGPPPFQTPAVKRGEPLIVELPTAADSPPPGSPSPPSPAVAPARPLPRTPTPARAAVASRPTPAPAPRVAESVPAPERRVE